MGLLIALIIIIAFLVLLGLVYIKLSFKYDENGAEISLKILFFKFLIYGEKEEKIRERKYKIKAFRRARDKRLAKIEKKKQKQALKASKKSSTELKKAKENPSHEVKENESVEDKTQKQKKKINPKELVSDILDIYGGVIKKFPGYLRIDCARLIVSVGGKDAHDIAINYGVTVQSVQYFATLLKSVTHFDPTKKAKISVYPDFAAGEWKGEADITMKLRLCHIISLGLRFGFAFLSADKKRQKRKKTA